MRIECNISEHVKVSLEAESFAEAELKISELMKDVLFRNDEIQKNAMKFSHSVDAYFEDKGKCHQHYAEFTHCPEVLAEIWESRRNIYMPYAVLDKLERMPTAKKKGHNIPISIIKQLPVAIHDPIAVFDSATDINGQSLVALLDLKSIHPASHAEQNLCAAVGFDVKGRIGTFNIIKSVYGRPDQQYRDWVRRDHIAAYVDTKRAAKWFPVTGLQLSGVKPFCGSKGTILTKEAFVKRKIEKFLPEIRKKFSEEQEMSI